MKTVTIPQDVYDDLVRDATRWRNGESVFAVPLTQFSGKDEVLWRFCEPDPMVGKTFGEAWDNAIQRYRR